MERNFTNENFERFLRQNADGLRMRPSDNVWKGINQHLKKKRRRTAFLLGITLLLTSASGYYFLEEAVDKTPANASAQPASIREVTGNGSPSQQPDRPATDVVSAKIATKNNTGSSVLLQELSPGNGTLPNSMVSGNTVELNLAPEGMALTGEPLTATTETVFTPTIVDDYPEEHKEEATVPPAAQLPATDPLTIESVTNSYKPRTGKKLGLQFFITPTVSYRRLSENKAFTRSNGNAVQQVYNINNAVTHKPDLGFQVGLLAKYPLGRNFKLRGGLQFNMNRYDIKTFNSAYEIATIQFRDMQTLNAVTSYNNFSGYKSDWLENFYFQLAAPVGVEMKISGNQKTELGIATTIQPTYLVGDKAYVISRDYKNYIEVPWLVRNWNVNAGLETFVSYSTKKVRWQVGPQVRYQLLSTYQKKYPVKEHLFDFGLKMGVSLNKH